MNTSSDTLKIGHFNVRCSPNLFDLITLAKSKNFDVLLLSDVNPSLNGLDNSTRIIHNQSDNFDACICILKPGLRYEAKIVLDHFVSIFIKEINLTLSAVYIRPHEAGNESYSQLLRGIIRRSRPHIIAGDVNARHIALGDTRTTERGADLMADLAGHGWTVMNNKGEITFENHSGRSINDWAFHSSTMNHSFFWSIDEDFDGMSDHRFCVIDLVFNDHSTITSDYLNTFISTKKFLNHITKHTSHSDLSQWHLHFSQAAAVATTHKDIKKRPKFWTPDLIKQKNRLSKEKQNLSRLKININSVRYARWREASTEFRKSLRSAYKIYWEENLKTDNQIFRQMRTSKGQLLDHVYVDNQLITDSTAVGAAILDHHFPFYPPEDHSDLLTNVDDDLPINHNEIVRSLKSFDTGKCPGEDHITIQTIRLWYAKDPEYILRLFNYWYTNNIYPEQLKDCMILPIQKNKQMRAEPKNTRPIGLLSVLGKVFEKIIDARLRYHLFSNNIISTFQHGFRSGHSTLHALHEIKYALDSQEFKFKTLISWDIAGAFNNISQKSIIQSLVDTQWNRNNVEIIKSYLSNRTVSIHIKGTKVTRPMNRGVVQGSKLSPSLFILGIDSIIRRVENFSISLPPEKKLTITAYADDLTVVIQNNASFDVNLQIANNVMRLVVSELAPKCLSLATSKTQLVHFYSSIPQPLAFIGNTLITPAPHVKILGVYFDQHLNFEHHLQYAIRKGFDTLSSINSIIQRRTTLDRSITKSIITTILAPRIHYASSIWLNDGMNIPLRSINKSLARIALGTWSTASYCASIILSPCLPIYWQAVINARMENVNRTRSFRGIKVISKLDHSKEYHPRADYTIDFAGSIENEADMSIINDPIRIFTDGSKYTHEGTDVVGAAVIIMHHETIKFQQKYKLPGESTVYIAEWTAIDQAMNLLYSLNAKQTVHILTDSLSCIHALKNNSFTNTLTDALKKKISAHTNRGITIRFWHCRAHNGTIGNEAADIAAKEAARTGTNITINLKTSKQVREIITAEISSLVDDDYTSDRYGITIKQFCYTTFDPRRQLLQITRASSKIYSGHINSLHHLHRMRYIQTNICSCGEIQDIQHLITRCRFMHENNSLSAIKVGLNPGDLANDWTVLTNNPRFHHYIADRAPSLMCDLKKLNGPLLDDLRMTHRLSHLTIKGQATKRPGDSATREITSKRQRLLAKHIRTWKKRNLEISSNSNSESIWPLFKKLRPDEST